MSSVSSTMDSISEILVKPTKTSNDLQQIINQWHGELLKNEENLLQYAHQLNQQQQSLNKTTESFVQAQDLISNLEKNLQQFQISIDVLAKYNDELESSIGPLNTDTKTLLPNIRSNLLTEHDRPATYELMESVDKQLTELQQTMDNLNKSLQINTNHSIVKITDDIQTCFHDVQQLQETIKQNKS